MKTNLPIGNSYFFKFLFLLLFFVSFGWVKGQTVTVGTGTTTHTYSPYDRYYYYGASEIIYLGSEINTTGTVTSLGWYVGTSASTGPNPVDIFMKTTTAATIGTTASTTGYTLVYSGAISNSATGYQTIALTTPFTYSSATGNLAILVVNRSNSYSSSFPYFRVTSTSSYRTSYYRNDTDAWASGTSTMTQIYNRPNIQLVFSNPCSGTPTGGTVTVTPSSGVAGSAYGITASGYTTGTTGLSYQWQYQDNATTGTWVNQGIATSSYTALTGQTAPAFGTIRYWRLLVTCSNSGLYSASTNTASFTSTFCTPAFSNTTDYINSFSLQSIVNNDNGFTTGGYQNWISLSTNLTESTSYNVSLTSSSGSGSHGAAIWIDFNNDGIFTTSERVGALDGITASQNVTIPITIPAGNLGSHRMRVIYQYNVAGTAIDPCATASYGEAEDYMVNIVAIPACTAPTTQAAMGAYTNNTTGSGLTVNWTRGNGNNVLVVACLTTTTDVAPTNTATYTANAAFGSGSTTGTGNFVVYNGSATSVNVTGLTPNTGYTFTAYEYNTTGPCYLKPGSSSATTTVTLPNDACANAATLACGTTGLAGTTVGAVAETTPPATTNASSYGVWYTFVGDGQSTTITSTPQSGFDNKMVVMSGSCGSLSLVGTAGTAGAGIAETYTFATVSGTTYYVYVAHTTAGSATTGTFTMARTCAATPANDLCGSAVALTADAAAISGTLTGATPTTAVTYAVESGINDVWYSFTPGCTGSYTITLSAFTNNKNLYVYNSCTATGIITGYSSASTTATTETITQSFTSGTTYYIRVTDFSGTGGTLNIRVTSNPLATLATSPTPSIGATGVCYSGSGAVTALSWTAAPGATSYDVYFGAGSLPGTVTANVTGTSWTITPALAANTTYYWKVVPRNGCDITTGTPLTWSFTTASGSCYCTPTYSSGGLNDIITRVQLEGLDDTTIPTGSPYYYDRRNVQNAIPTLTQGVAYVLSVTVGSDSNQYGRAWIDFNQNGIFEASESFSTGTNWGANGVGILNIVIPAGAVLGNTILRIRAADDSEPTGSQACGASGSSFGRAVDYNVNIIAPLPCAGTPTGGTATVTPNSGIVGSTYAVSATDYSIGLGLTYQWQYQDNSTTGTWNNQGAATSAYAGLTGQTAPTTVGTTRYWRLLVTCTNAGGGTGNSSITAFTTLSSNYCTPGVSSSYYANYLYFTNVKFLGTLNDTTNISTYSTSPSGFQNFTGLSNKAVQVQGEGVNVYVGSSVRGIYKAWIDWNNDGDFLDTGEAVYDVGGTVQASTTFGFVIPEDAILGDHRMRIRVSYETTNPTTFGPCDTLSYDGETEDYLFTVAPKCNAKILTVTDGSRCGIGNVIVSATATSAASKIHWYSAETGGTYIGESNPGANFTLTGLASTTVVWAEAYSATCSSTYRIAVNATVKLTPEISISTANVEVCGETSAIEVSATGNNEVVHLVDEDFEGGTLGVFTNINIVSNSSGNNSKTMWQNRQSTFVPSEQTWYPAISSGYKGNKFVMATSDIGSLTTENALESPVLDTRNFTDLTLKFKMYYSRYYVDGAYTADDFVNVEISTNSGATWSTATPVENMTYDVGIGTRFAQKSYNFNAYTGNQYFRFRIRYHAVWCDGVAVDDVQLYGERPLMPSFTFSSNHPIGIYRDAAGTIPYVYDSGNPNNPLNFLSKVYVKPDATQLEQYDSWTVNATAVLTNSCNAVGAFTINNSSTVWNNAAAVTNWNTASDWKPNGLVPTNDKCVVIKSPVNISSATNGVAKNITIKSGGKLEIAGSLIVEENIVNQNTGTTAADQFVVLSDGNYIQKSTIANTVAGGVIRVDRAVVDMDNMPNQLDYVYWGSPVTGQNIREFSPGTPWNRRFQYNEATDYFVPATEANFVPGKGYAIEAETNSNGGHLPNPTGYDETYKFRGVPNNGDISMPIQRTNAGTTGAGLGYNLVGNPYPSNIKFEELYSGNSALIFNTAWFWTNNNFTAAQQGSGYEGNNYAVYNGTGGAPATANGSGNYPTGIVKAGQGFMIQKKATGSGNLVFKNSYGAGKDLRVTTPGTFFQRGASSTKDRFWLEMVSPAGMYNTQLIGYIDGATDGYEQDYDAEAFGMSADLFYSLLVDKKLVINGKSHNFNVEDTVPLGANIFNSGEYKIQLRDPEGRFANGQSIYIKDKVSGLLTNLSEGSYTFLANKGVTEGRFEIIYKPETILTVDNSVKDGNLIVYRDGEDFAVHSTSKTIDFVEVYDMSGRLYKTIKAGDKIVRFSAQNMASGTYILKIIHEGEVSNKRILK